MIITAIVVDDELNSRENLKLLLEDFCDNIEVVGVAATVKEANELIIQHKPNVVFLDIQMRGETGFDLLENFDDIKFEVMFITAYSDYALKAIKFSAVDYLLKPIDIEELQDAVEKVRKKVENKKFYPENIQVLLQNLNPEKEGNYKLALHTSEGMAFIQLKEIMYCEGATNGTTIFSINGKKHFVQKSLKEYETILQDYGFVRIHKSYLVNLAEIKKVTTQNGDQITLKDNSILPLNSKNKEDLIKRISEL